MSKHFGNSLILTLLLMASLVRAEPSTGSWLQLNRLNQLNQQRLERIQKAYAEPRGSIGNQPWWTRQGLDWRQQREQRALQHNQQHQQLIQEQRDRFAPTDRSRRLEGLFRQQHFRQVQERQLERFRLQQQLGRLPR